MADTDSRGLDAGDRITLPMDEVAHRLRTPLTAIKGFADLLTVTDDPQVVREYIQTIRSNAALLDRMLAELGEGRMPSVPGDKGSGRRRSPRVPASRRPPK